MSNIVEPQITVTKSSMFGDIFKNSIPFIPPSMQKPFVGKPNLSQQLAQQQAQYEIAQQQALQQAQQQAVMVYLDAYNNRLTDKVFGKTEGYGIERAMKLGAYIILGAVVGRYVAKNMKKSTTLGMVLGGLAPLLALKLTMEYDKINMPKQEPRQKVGMNPDGSIMTEKQIANTQVSSDISKFIPQNKPKPYMPQVKPSGLGFNLNCPNGTKKVTVACAVAPCPEMEVCA